ncbi:unnamed protein product [Phytophthora fragariaefolia]|uniref:Unnamed protein product n=1 Tax=Phytophthora fragariaefolia TaxID=1490495 RepID=A0A9W6Y4S4_9STRA|nr:unnamed protein product [Phytophthora fragariaefolia]
MIIARKFIARVGWTRIGSWGDLLFRGQLGNGRHTGWMRLERYGGDEDVDSGGESLKAHRTSLRLPVPSITFASYPIAILPAASDESRSERLSSRGINQGSTKYLDWYMYPCAMHCV